MSKQIAIREAVSAAPVKNGKRWRVIVARPGQGSSGNYTEEMFRRDAHNIIAPGGQSFINHDDSRNPKDMIGVYPEGSFWSEEDNAVVSELEVFSHWEKFVEEVGPHCGISLYALGESDEDGNVTSIIPDRLNGADLVARPGLIGSGLAEKLYESAVAHSTEPSVTSAQEERKLEMEKDVEERFTALETLLTSLVAKEDAAKAEAAQAEADKDAGRKAVEAYDLAVVAIDKAELPEKVVEALRTQAKAGADVTALIEQAVAIKEASDEAAEARVTDAATQGRVLGSTKVETAVDLGKAFG